MWIVKKICLYIMTKKGLEVLKILDQRFGSPFIRAVISANDPNVQYDYYDQIAAYCSEHNIPFFNRKEDPKIFSDYIIAISWRWLIKLNEHSKLIVFHDSLLPRYRGFSPLVSALINGEKELGVTAFFAQDSFDEGDIIFQESIKIEYPITIQAAIETVSGIYGSLAEQIGAKIAEGKEIFSTKQRDADATYSLWRDADDYFINWNQDAEKIKRFIDAVGYPYNGAAASYNRKILRIIDSEVLEDITIENRTPGKILRLDNGCPIVVCGRGLIKLTGVNDETGNSYLPFRKLRIRFN